MNESAPRIQINRARPRFLRSLRRCDCGMPGRRVQSKNRAHLIDDSRKPIDPSNSQVRIPPFAVRPRVYRRSRSPPILRRAELGCSVAYMSTSGMKNCKSHNRYRFWQDSYGAEKRDGIRTTTAAWAQRHSPCTPCHPSCRYTSRISYPAGA